MTSDETQLPSGWAETTLEAVCRILDSRRIPVNKSERSRRIEGRDEDELYPYYGATGKVGEIDDFIFEGEHVLVGEDGAPFLDFSKSKAYLVRGKFWVNNHAHIVKASVSNAFVCHYLNQIDYSVHVTGTTRLKLTQDALRRLPLRVAPANEQVRIVAKVEELFSELDKGIDSLKTARRQLEVYRQSVLKHAFEGKLTAQWREENKDKLETPEQLLARSKKERMAYSERRFQEWRRAVKEWEDGDRRTDRPKKPPSPKLFSKLDEHLRTGLPHLPESWVWEKLGWMTCGVEYGTAAKSSKSGNVPVMRMGNIQNGTFDWTDLVYTSDNDEIAGYLLHDGDVLFNRTNSPELVGKTAIYRGERPAIFAGYLIRVNQLPAVVESEYVNFFLNSDVARQYGNSVKTDGVNQSNINGAKLVNYPFPYCSVQEQREIVRILDKTMSTVDDTESRIRVELARSVVLRQSILKKAFAGHLVAQDPSDEPASVLLEKIKTERAKAGKSGPTARKNRKAKTAA